MILLEVFSKKKDFLLMVENLKELPHFIRPKYFSDTEEKYNKTNKIINTKRFCDFLNENSFGFFLFSEENICIDISLKNEIYTTLTFYIPEKYANSVNDIFITLLLNKPVFGFATYDPERKYDEVRGYTINNYKDTDSEYEYRNRHFTKIKNFSCEAWIGLNLNKYISGLYWYTLISAEIAKKFKIDLYQLKKNALEYQVLQESDVLLLKFYEDPTEWKQHALKLDNLCSELTGIFSRKPLDSKLTHVDDMFLYNQIIDMENDD